LDAHPLVNGDGGVVVHLGTLEGVAFHHHHHLGQILALEPVLFVLDDYEVDDAGCRALEELGCC
jgi:hypothetical protein